MKRIDQIKNMDSFQLAHLICDLFEECENCPLKDKCEHGKNGWQSWLDKEVEDPRC